MSKFLLIFCCLALSLTAGEAKRITLNGEWKFALDYANAGEQLNWQNPSDDKFDSHWDLISVPHCWSIDPRYSNYVGAGWYRRTFSTPKFSPNEHVELQFGAVFYRATVWLNGTLIGEHEGGYTPFSFDVTKALKPGEPNSLVVKADNRWSTETLPGARPGSSPRDLLYPWWDYAGIIRDVELVVTPAVYIKNMKVHAEPDLASGTATISVATWIANTGSAVAQTGVEGQILSGKEILQSFKIPAQSIPAGQSAPLQAKVELEKSKVKLWDLDHPHLYDLVLTTSGTAEPFTTQTHLGIRKIETKNAQLLLNGKPIRVGGANRVVEDAQFASLEPPSVIDRDLRQMKEAGMELMRIAHYPLSPVLLDWADRHGLLLIEEAGNWNLRQWQLDSPVIRGKLRKMAKEMIERDWNHPSIIGWSVGNEYESQLPAGARWTRDMREYYRGLDDTRLITFADNRGWLPDVQKPEDGGSFYSDMVGLNVYGPVASVEKRLDHMHELYPEKPILITEWGLRADKVSSEEVREKYAAEFMNAIRKRPWIVGASLWTYNDYRSRFPDTNKSGVRPWGMVHYDRTPYPVYYTIQKEFAPVSIRSVEDKGNSAIVVCAASKEFPHYGVSGYALIVKDGNSEQRYPISDLSPGGEAQVEVRGNARGRAMFIERPGGFRFPVQVPSAAATEPTQ